MQARLSSTPNVVLRRQGFNPLIEGFFTVLDPQGRWMKFGQPCDVPRSLR